MATWNISVPAGSGVGSGGSGSSAITEPGDFDGSTITDVSVSGSPSVTSDATSNDTIGVRWRIQTSTGTAIWGDYGSDAASACSASVGSGIASATITDGSSPSPAPGTAVGADWDEVAYSVNYSAQGKNDAETVSWSGFTIVVTYTPAGATSVDATSDSFTLTENAQSIDIDMTVNSDSFTLTENAASIDFDLSAGIDTFTLSEHSATIQLLNTNSRGGDTAPAFVLRSQRGRRLLTPPIQPVIIDSDTAFTATTDSFTLTENAASIDLDITPTTDSFTLTEYAASIDLDITPTVDAFTLTENAATVDLLTGVTATLDSFTLTENAASIDFDLSASLDSFTLTENAASIDFDLSANVDSFTLTEFAASIDLDITTATDSFTLTENTQTITLGVAVSATTDSFTLTENAASVDLDITTGTDSFTLTEYSASISLTNENSRGGASEPFVTRRQSGRKLQTLQMPLFSQTTPAGNVDATTDSFTLTEYSHDIKLDSERKAGAAVPFITRTQRGKRIPQQPPLLPFSDAERVLGEPETPGWFEPRLHNRRIKFNHIDPEFVSNLVILAGKAEPAVFPDFFFDVTSRHNNLIQNRTNRRVITPEVLTYYEPPPAPPTPDVVAWQLAEVNRRYGWSRVRVPERLDYWTIGIYPGTHEFTLHEYIQGIEGVIAKPGGGGGGPHGGVFPGGGIKDDELLAIITEFYRQLWLWLNSDRG